MRHNVLHDHPEIYPEHFDAATIAELRQAFPDAWVEVPADLIAQMDNEPEDRHVLATGVSADAQVIVTANTPDFISSRFVASGQIRIETPAEFLIASLDENESELATVLAHLATNRRGVRTIGDVLDQLDRNETLTPFVELARSRLL